MPIGPPDGLRRQGPRHKPPLAKRLGVLLASSLLVFALAEIGLRAWGYDPIGRIAAGNQFMIEEAEDPELMYRFAANSEGEMWGSRIKINSGGFRDREVPVAKPPGRLRALALGDSVTFGSGLEVSERWSDFLEGFWRLFHLDAEVFNLGVPGYDVAQEVLFLERKGLAYDPDQVILCFCINDLETTSFNYETIATLKRFRGGLLSWSRAAQWVTLALDRTRQFGEMGRIRDAERIQAASVRITPDPELDRLIAALHAAVASAEEVEEPRDGRYRERLQLFTELGRLQLVRNAFERLAELAEERGFGVTIFISPVLYEGLDAAGWRIAYDIVGHLAESCGFRFVDVYPAVKEEPLESYQIKPTDFIHANAQANKVMARVLAQATRDWFE